MATPNTATFHTLQLVLWLLNFFGSVVGLFSSIYLIILHDDLQSRMIEAVELSHALNRFCPIEYVSSIIVIMTAYMEDSAPLWVRLVPLPLVLFNLTRIAGKEHRVYFITKREYPKFNQIER